MAWAGKLHIIRNAIYEDPETFYWKPTPMHPGLVFGASIVGNEVLPSASHSYRKFVRKTLKDMGKVG